MKKIIIALIFLSLSPICQAQFWKKKKVDEPRSKPMHVQPTAGKRDSSNTQELTKLKKPVPPSYPQPIKKERYRVDVLLSLGLDQLVENDKAVMKDIPSHLLPAFHFYAGIKLAVKDLNEASQKVDIYIHDINSKGKDIATLLSQSSLRETDLMIAFLQSSEIAPLAAFAKENHINLLSALSPSATGIEDNPYLILVQPTLSTHIDELVGYAIKKFGNLPKYVLSSEKTAVQEEALDELKSALATIDYTEIELGTRKQDLAAKFDTSKTNLVFVNILSVSESFKVLQELAQLAPKYRFKVFGMPSWKTMPSAIVADSFANLDIYYTSPFFYDLNSRLGKEIIERYNKSYTGTASEMVFRGYESIYWTVDLLSRYGTVFNEHIHDVRFSPFTRYAVKPVWSKDNDFLYLENKNLYIFRCSGGIVLLQD